jgi:hypothetical protein
LILLPPSEKKLATTKPTPAMSVYSGVLYQALDWASLSPAAKKRGDAALAIISAQYGVVRTTSRIEAYKKKINNKEMAPIVAAALDGAESTSIADHLHTKLSGERRQISPLKFAFLPLLMEYAPLLHICRRRREEKSLAGYCNHVRFRRVQKISMRSSLRNIPAH